MTTRKPNLEKTDRFAVGHVETRTFSADGARTSLRDLRASARRAAKAAEKTQAEATAPLHGMRDLPPPRELSDAEMMPVMLDLATHMGEDSPWCHLLRDLVRRLWVLQPGPRDPRRHPKLDRDGHCTRCGLTLRTGYDECPEGFWPRGVTKRAEKAR